MLWDGAMYVCVSQDIENGLVAELGLGGASAYLISRHGRLPTNVALPQGPKIINKNNE